VAFSLSPQYHLLELRGPDSGIYASLRQAEFSEITEKTLFFSDFLRRKDQQNKSALQRKAQTRCEGRERQRAEGIGHRAKSIGAFDT